MSSAPEPNILNSQAGEAPPHVALTSANEETIEEALALHDDNKTGTDNKDPTGGDDHEEKKVVTLTESTHSLLFTEEIFSLGFAFAFSIAGISYASLILALWNNSNQGSSSNPFNIPAQVSRTVRGSQYLALIIGLLMEEEIPQGLLLLMAISKDSLMTRFPQIKFGKFVFSAVVRLVMGYIFLTNMFLVIIQASDVLEIFYDILALQFVQLIDDISFNLAKNGLFGKRLKNATNQKCFQAEFEKQPFLFRRRMNIFLKVLYFLNMFSLLAGTITVSVRQDKGYYQCRSITVSFGKEIWENALVKTSTGNDKEMVLVYSYFNGMYKYNGTQHGYPIYTEQNKFDNTPFETKSGAVIKYCPEEEAWVFAHENIRKSGDSVESDCPWLLRSPATTEYNLLDVPNEWTVWTGIITYGAHVSILCDECNESSDCNYHGTCIDAKCVCSEEEGFFGTHCEHEKPCETIIGDFNDTWRIAPLDNGDFFLEYGRPVYKYKHGLTDGEVAEEDTAALIYCGDRWFGTYSEGGATLSTDYWIDYSKNFHPFWDEVYTVKTIFVSDPTAESTPVGVDFYEIGERGDRYGPFGVLNPVQFPQGRGYYRCANVSSVGDE